MAGDASVKPRVNTDSSGHLLVCREGALGRKNSKCQGCAGARLSMCENKIENEQDREQDRPQEACGLRQQSLSMVPR